MGFLAKMSKVTATYPWDDPKSEEDMKKYFSPEHRKTDFKRNQKSVEFRDKTISLVISVESYLTDLEECPDDKEMVLVSKDAVQKMIKEADVIRKLRDDWVALDRLHLSQLVGK